MKSLVVFSVLAAAGVAPLHAQQRDSLRLPPIGLQAVPMLPGAKGDCPMPVKRGIAGDSSAVARLGNRTVDSMPTARSGCRNPLVLADPAKPKRPQ